MDTAHSEEVQEVYKRLLANSTLEARVVEMDDGSRVHILEKGDGPPVVLLHGTGEAAAFLLPMLERLEHVSVLAVDRPGHGLSDHVEMPRGEYRERAVSWMDRLLNTLDVETVVLGGNSMGGLWSLWYTLAHPDRVDRLVLLSGIPLLPKPRSPDATASVPLPFRLMAISGVGELLQKLPTTPKAVLQFARFVGEEETLARLPQLVDLLVAAGGDPVTANTIKAEVRMVFSPFALVLPSARGMRSGKRLQRSELMQVTVPVLLTWGENDFVGNISLAEEMATLFPDARLDVLPTGHGPWLGYPDRVSAKVADFAT